MEESSNEMQNKCIGYFDKDQLEGSPNPKNDKKYEENEDLMNTKFSYFKPVENLDFDLFNGHSSPSLLEVEVSEELELLDYLFSFLDSKKILNVTSAGYFAKVVHALMNKRFIDLALYLQKKNNILMKLINTCYNLSICEIISRLLRIDKPYTTEDYFTQNVYFPVNIFFIFFLFLLIFRN